MHPLRICLDNRFFDTYYYGDPCDVFDYVKSLLVILHRDSLIFLFQSSVYTISHVC